MKVKSENTKINTSPNPSKGGEQATIEDITNLPRPKPSFFLPFGEARRGFNLRKQLPLFWRGLGGGATGLPRRSFLTARNDGAGGHHLFQSSKLWKRLVIWRGRGGKNLENPENLTKILVQDKMRVCSLFLLLVFFSCQTSFGQNRHFTIGYNDNGLTFGNSAKTNGIRINFLDKNVDMVNGLNLAAISKSRVSNGFTLGLLWIESSICNGIVINGLLGESKKINGIFISGLGGAASKINGLGIGGLAVVGDTLNGLFISSFGAAYMSTERIKLINGVTVGGFIGASTEKLNGLSISVFNNWIDELNGLSIGMINVIGEQKGISIGIFNRAEKLRGVQIGIWNVAKNNKFFKYMPIINFNFRKN